MKRKARFSAVLVVGIVALVVCGAGSYFARQTGDGEQPGDVEEGFIYEPGDLRNPFLPLLVMTPTPTMTPLPTETPTPKLSAERFTPTPSPIPFPDIVLNGIIGDTDNSVAILNSQMLRVGEFILGARVTLIRNDTVYLDFHGRPMRLVLPEAYTISID